MSNIGNFRNPVFGEPLITSGIGPNIMQTPFGNVRTSQMISSVPPPLPPPLQQIQANQYGGNYGNYGGNNYNSYASPMLGGNYGFGGGFGGFGSGFGSYGGGYGSSYGGRYGGTFTNPNDPENRFIQMAEESSRPAFQSIESLVAAIGNIASMLDSTFFAITSSFRAILGVAANFGRLRGVFAQFWSTFAIFRGLSWLYKKILYMLKLSNIDPNSIVFKEAFSAAQGMTNLQNVPDLNGMRRSSPWPVLAFLGFIFTAPYLIMKLIGSVTNSALEESRDPQKWIRPIPSQVMFDFQARGPQELTIRAGQTILVAPRDIQNTHKLMSTGWALATIDRQTSGLIPITYVQGPNQIKREQQQQSTTVNNNIINDDTNNLENILKTKNSDEFFQPIQSVIPDSEDLKND